MSELQKFDFHGMALQAVLLDGEPWFLGSDLANLLEYRDGYTLLRGIDDEDTRIIDVSRITTHFMRGNPNRSFVSEAGLYQAILSAKTERVKPFKKWVTAEVLPAIRKTGEYKKPLSLQERSLALISDLSEEIRQQQARLEIAEPKAQVFDEFMTAEGSYEIGDAAKLLRRAGIDTGPTRLFWELDRIGWTFKRGETRHIKQEVYEQQLLVYKGQSYRHPSTGERRTAAPQIRITPKGLEKLRLKMLPPLETLMSEEN